MYPNMGILTSQAARAAALLPSLPHPQPQLVPTVAAITDTRPPLNNTQ